MLCERNRCKGKEKTLAPARKIAFVLLQVYFVYSVLHVSNCNISIFNIMICTFAVRMKDLR